MPSRRHRPLHRRHIRPPLRVIPQLRSMRNKHPPPGAPTTIRARQSTPPPTSTHPRAASRPASAFPKPGQRKGVPMPAPCQIHRDTTVTHRCAQFIQMPANPGQREAAGELETTFGQPLAVVRQEHGTGVSPVAWDRAGGPVRRLAVADDYGWVWRRSSGGLVRQWHGTTPRVPRVEACGWSSRSGTFVLPRVLRGRKGVPAGPSGASPCGPGGSGAGCAARPGR